MTDLLKDKVAIVFGGTGHVGMPVCKLLAAEGAKVVVHYNSSIDKAAKIVEEINSSLGEAIAIQADIRDEDEVDILVEKTVKLFGRVDIVVNTVHRDFNPVYVRDMKWKDWDVHLEGLKVHFNICKSVLPFMRKQHFGRIIFISGGLSYRLYKGCAAYTTIKAGLNGFCKTLALEEGESGITVNIVAPGAIMEDNGSSSMDDAEAWENIEDSQSSKIPLGRLSTGEDTADAVLYFASPLASYITGQTIFVTGGEIMPMP